MNSKITPWYEVYKIIAEHLHLLYDRNRENPAAALFTACTTNPDFKKANQWIESKWTTDGLDPIQIFSSINSSTLGENLRLSRIGALFDILGLDKNQYYDKIDFSGCPTPVAIKLLSYRENQVQNRIWQVFAAVMANGQDGLTDAVFTEVNQWPGISIPSFTIFLFWINPRNFLPLDKNTVTLIIASDPKLDPVHTYADYRRLIWKKDTDDYLEMARFARMAPEAQKNDSFRREIVRGIVGEVNNPEGGGIRLLGVKVLDKCSKDLHAPLKKKVLYTFFDAYTFEEGKEEISYHPEKDHILYNTEDLNIQVNAIVGKNGVGKSSLTQLILAIINNLSCIFRNNGQLREVEYPLEWIEGLHAEMYFKADKLFRITIDEDYNASFRDYRFEAEKYRPSDEKPIQQFRLFDFFYTLYVNYSIHGLNDQNTPWINSVFRKNDGYQIPVTIDPYRENGTIRADSLEELTMDRLLVNILEPVTDLQVANPRMLTEYQQASKLELQLNKEKVAGIFLKGRAYPIEHFEGYADQLEFFLRLYGVRLEISAEITSQTIIGGVLIYIYRKLISIADTYMPYLEFLENERLVDPNRYFYRLYTDNSHITYKLRQAINYLKFDHLPREDEAIIDIEDLSRAIFEIQQKNSSLEIIELIPPSCFDVEIQMSDQVTNQENFLALSPFSKLSSGEKQIIFVVNAITYHLRNINSVHDGQNGLITYSYVNIILDEVELYFHPDMQRVFISRLLYQIEVLDLSNIKGINFLFITHSPFILSDIPRGNVLFLDRVVGEDTNLVKEANKKNTFGANIHELLADSFFMSDTLGAFAAKKVDDIMVFHRRVLEADEGSRIKLMRDYESIKQEFYFIRDNIGENYLQAVIDENILEIESTFETSEYRQRRIRQLQEEIEKLK